MARKIDQRMNIIISCTVPDTGPVTINSLTVEGAVSNPTGLSEFDRGPWPIRGEDPWNGSMSGTAIVNAMLARLKANGGVP